MAVTSELRNLPGVDALLKMEAAQSLIGRFGQHLTVEAARSWLGVVRRQIMDGHACPSGSQLVEGIAKLLEQWAQPTLRPVINATGIVIHTNMGRAPLCAEALQAIQEVASGYSNLEYDLDAGARGSRYVHAERLLCRLTGAEGALVVNNNAAAVLLVLTALARGHEVVISRGQLVEIGGGFRIPDVMRESGARLVEVGTTNRTHLHDYQEALGPDTAMVMLAHQSNFRMLGFTAQVPAIELVALARSCGVLAFEDLGSGTLLDTAVYGLRHEPTVQEAVAADLDLVSFSGDKLLGGPQAGILVGKADLIERLRRFPLTRALRVDKMTLAALQATLLHYLKGDAERAIPVWRMLAAPLDELGRRARRWANKFRSSGLDARVMDGLSAAGGGSLPGETLPTRLAAIAADSPDRWATRLREYDPPVIARIEDNLLCFDPRTVLPEQEDALVSAVQAAASSLCG